LTRARTLDETPPEAPDPPAVPPHVVETLEPIGELHKRAERAITPRQRSIETLTALIGRPFTVFAIPCAVVAWVALNAGLAGSGHVPIDPPPYAWLQATASVGALIMAAMVLATQSRQRKRSDELEQLDLQVNLLAEQKLAKLISLVVELRRDMPNIVDRVDPLAEAMTQAVDPHAVADALRQTIEDASARPTPETQGTPRKP
jgi:uncharacterized membrane protein